MRILPIEVYLREENVVTGAGVRLEDFGHMVLQIQVKARISNKWVQISHFKVTNCLQTLILTILSTLSSLFSLLYGSHWLLQVLFFFRPSNDIPLPRYPRLFGCKPAVFRGKNLYLR